MSTSRRELLMMGGAGVAALAFPSFLPSSSALALAQRSTGPDPIAAALVQQFQRMIAGLAANPPRGSAREAAASYRMLAAWGKANKIDAQIKRFVTDAVEREGHDNLVSRLVATDWPAELKRHGLPVPPNFRSPNYTQFAKGIGYVKGGFSLERHWSHRAWKINRKAASFDRMMAILNGRQPDAVIRRVQEQDADGDGLPDSIDGYDDRCQQEVYCEQTSANSFSCTFSTNNYCMDGGAEPGWCDDAEIFMILTALFLSGLGMYYTALWLSYLALLDQAYFSLVLYLSGCL
jgi:hypothetical protein